MTDLVERLRATFADRPYLPSVCAEAADEIERLTAALTRIVNLCSDDIDRAGIAVIARTALNIHKRGET